MKYIFSIIVLFFLYCTVVMNISTYYYNESTRCYQDATMLYLNNKKVIADSISIIGYKYKMKAKKIEKLQPFN